VDFPKIKLGEFMSKTGKTKREDLSAEGGVNSEEVDPE